MLRTCALVLLFLLPQTIVAAPQPTLRDSLIADFDTFVTLLEQTHPDPYTRFGGKVSFHRETSELRLRLASEEHTVRDFSLLLSQFLCRLGDGHSFVAVPPLPDSNDEAFLPVEISVIPEGLILTKLPKEYKHLIGSRIVAVEGVSVDDLAERTKRFAPVENRYGAYAQLQGGLSRVSYLKELLAGDELLSTVGFRLLTPDGKETLLSLKTRSAEALPGVKMTERPAWELREACSDYLSWRFADNDKRIMLFRLGSIMARENLLYMRDVGRPSFRDELESFYRYTLRRPMPAAEAEALAGVPSLAETFRAMLLEMKAAGATDLIIDLRGNGGGWTPIVYPTLYMLYGDAYLAKDMDAHLYHLISPLYLANRNVTLEEYNRLPKVDIDPFHRDYVTDYRMGDYTFPRGDTDSVEQIRDCFVRSAMGDAGASMSDLEGQSLYHPRVYVLTDARTYSAAFHYAFYLWKMGATLVGVPSSLAPNTYMEGTPFRLPLTGVGGGFSNSQQRFLPDDDPRATTLYPDLMPTASDYRRYGFDKHSEILYLLDIIKGASVGQ